MCVPYFITSRESPRQQPCYPENTAQEPPSPFQACPSRLLPLVRTTRHFAETSPALCYRTGLESLQVSDEPGPTLALPQTWRLSALRPHSPPPHSAGMGG